MLYIIVCLQYVTRYDDLWRVRRYYYVHKYYYYIHTPKYLWVPHIVYTYMGVSYIYIYAHTHNMRYPRVAAVRTDRCTDREVCTAMCSPIR